MATSVDDLYKKASELPPEQRAALAGLLVDTLDKGVVDPDVEDTWRREVARRIAEIDSGTIETVPWERVRQKLLNICGQS
jgi:putative addiction module component (TIGR02574 family)